MAVTCPTNDNVCSNMTEFMLGHIHDSPAHTGHYSAVVVNVSIEICMSPD